MDHTDKIENGQLETEEVNELSAVMTWAKTRLEKVEKNASTLREELAREEKECQGEGVEFVEQREKHISWLKEELRESEQLLDDFGQLVTALEDFMLRISMRLKRKYETEEKKRES